MWEYYCREPSKTYVSNCGRLTHVPHCTQTTSFTPSTYLSGIFSGTDRYFNFLVSDIVGTQQKGNATPSTHYHVEIAHVIILCRCSFIAPDSSKIITQDSVHIAQHDELSLQNPSQVCQTVNFEINFIFLLSNWNPSYQCNPMLNPAWAMYVCVLACYGNSNK